MCLWIVILLLFLIHQSTIRQLLLLKNLLPLSSYFTIYIYRLHQMEKQINPQNINHSFWLDCFGELNDHGNYDLQLLPLPSQFENDAHGQSTEKTTIQLKDYSNQDLIDMISMQDSVNKQLFKNSHPVPIIDDEFFTSNTSSSDMRNSENNEVPGEIISKQKKEKYAKQYIYSKNYRDKKKEQFKALEEENKFLKNKVDELHMRLRQMEMEINRLKHHPTEKELTIEEINRQYIQDLQMICGKMENTLTLDEKEKLSQKSRTALEEQFLKRYEMHGICGTRKRQILNYHMNEIFEVALRDSEKYLCMLCCKNKDDRFEKQMPEFQRINMAFFQIMELKEGDIAQIKTCTKTIFPAMKQIKKECSEMYKSYKKVLMMMDRIHQFMKISYVQNNSLLIKKMKLENWFEYHKYHKIMRRLKAEWIEFIKNKKQNDNNRQQRGCKRKKIKQMDEQ